MQCIPKLLLVFSATLLVAHGVDESNVDVDASKSVSSEAEDQTSEASQFKILDSSASDADTPPSKSGDASLMLLGGTGFIVSIFYLVNSPRQSVKDQTWSMLNLAVSIFCAVLVNGAVDDMFTAIFGLSMADADSTHPPTIGRIISASVQLIIWWHAIVAILFFSRGSLLHLKGYGTIGGHIMGFAALNVYGQIALTEVFRGSPLMTVLVIVIATITLVLLFKTGALAKVIADKMDVEEDEMAAWHDQIADTGSDFFALTIAFLFSMLMRFLVSGSLPSIDGELGGATQTQCIILGFVGLVWLVVAKITNMIPDKTYEDKCAAFSDFIHGVPADTAAFCWLFALMWYIGTIVGEELMAHAAVAVIFSIGAIIHVLFGVGSVGFVGLAVGFSWEKVFDAAVDGVGDLSVFSGGHAKVYFSFLLVIIVFPAWIVYILTKADPDLKKKYGNTSLPLSAVASCGHDYDEESDQDNSGEE